ncbi:MAG: bifunctional methylenetetrahydrofolate dehydrogenase/methenyltetrahydrofolate cyclohydrolase FolD [Candidatus Lokiarchaeota archaeon]|nr:bifunctional methylenetetrahydrofolate dehydrogenase/methenyltetrahydrofolate cyclohydrolase FolD [Candidatus Lokiarchaeota archaeon]
MSEKILDGKKLADLLNAQLKKKINQSFNKTKIQPILATILVGQDPASKVYVNIKHKTCADIGINSVMVDLDETISKKHLLQKIEEINNDEKIHGILLQLPLPQSLRGDTEEFLERISYVKDVDGFHPINRGRLFDYHEELSACTPKGIVKLLTHYNIELAGKHVVIVNRSNLVGKPLVFMLLKRNATVTVCHSYTRTLENITQQADILVVGVGKAKFITKEMIKEGAIIIDVGTNRLDGKLCGDVDFNNVFEKCGLITPVPGGVGPLTVSFLLQNTYYAYKNQLNL